MPRRRYGAHLSKEQVADLVAPLSDTLTLVNSWLEHHGVRPSSISQLHGGGLLTVIGVSVLQANHLSASYQLYRHVKTVLRMISYWLPAELHTHKNHRANDILRLSAYAVADSAYAPRRDEGGVGRPREGVSRSDEYVTPSFLRWLYNTLGYVATAVDRNRPGIAGFLGKYPSPDDLKLFMDEFRTDGADATFAVVEINGGGYDSDNLGMEGNVDLQYTESMAFPTPHTSTVCTPRSTRISSSSTTCSARR